MTKTKKIIAVVTIIIIAGLGLVFAKSDEKTEISEKQQMIDSWAKAGEKKYEEISKKREAEKLLQEAEQARLEKEKLLGLTGSSGGLIQ